MTSKTEGELASCSLTSRLKGYLNHLIFLFWKQVMRYLSQRKNYLTRN